GCRSPTGPRSRCRPWCGGCRIRPARSAGRDPPWASTPTRCCGKSDSARPRSAPCVTRASSERFPSGRIASRKASPWPAPGVPPDSARAAVGNRAGSFAAPVASPSRPLVSHAPVAPRPMRGGRVAEAGGPPRSPPGLDPAKPEQEPPTLLPQRPDAVLALADGTIFRGHSIGAPTEATGEAVFNTAMTGYQEILTDPSYARQIVTLTYPHIGNVGVNPEDAESGRIQAAGLVIKDLPPRVSSWRATDSLSNYLAHEGVPAIAGIDTRRLTRLLRERGAQNASIVAAAEPAEPIDVGRAVAAARAFPGLAGMDLARVVSTPSAYRWSEGSWRQGSGHQPAAPSRFKVVAYDFGVKRNILRLLADRGCEIVVVPARTSLEEALAHAPDGI